MYLIAASLLVLAYSTHALQTDMQLLLDFAASTNTSQACGTLPAWNPRSNVSTWPGVVMDNMKVVKISVPNQNLCGTLPAAWSRLTALTNLELGNNSLSGTLPAAWSTLTNLKYVDVSSNNVTGNLPDAWSSLGQLTCIVAHSKRVDKAFSSLPSGLEAWSQMQEYSWLLNRYNATLTGPLPNTWSALEQLKILDLSGHSLTSTLPASWSQLTNLTRIRLALCALTGPAPVEWGNLVQLAHLDLLHNTLTGTLPASWSSMANLRYLNLFDAHKPPHSNIRGTLPAVWGSMLELTELDIAGTGLIGLFPTAWSSLQNLVVMCISSNSEPGRLPGSWSSLTNLQHFVVSFSGLPVPGSPREGMAGTLPESWSTLTHLQQLVLQNNQISGQIPQAWSSLVQLSILQLAGNRLFGTLPTILLHLEALTSLSLAGNDFSGSLPEIWAEKLKGLATLSLADNSLTGTLPEAWTGMANLGFLKLSRNQFEGRLPLSWGSFTRLFALDVSFNRLYGMVPEAWLEGMWHGLFSVDLSSNQLLGDIPPVPNHAMTFNASNNSFTGTLGNIPASLMYLHVGMNNLTGRVPALDTSAANLGYINLANNSFAVLPSSFAAPKVLFLSLANNSLHGGLADLKAMGSLEYADLSGNHLTGSVPLTWWYHHWTYLSLHSNYLTGSLPNPMTSKIGILLLQKNRFTGCLPDRWPNNGSLKIMVMSRNDLRCSDGLPATWGVVQNNSSFQNLSFLDLSNTKIGGLIPSSWLVEQAFPAVKEMRMGALWEASAKKVEWRQAVCMNPMFNTKASNLTASGLSLELVRGFQNHLEASLLTGVFNVVNQLNYTMRMRFVYETVSSLVIPLAIDSRSASGASLRAVCGNKNARLIVAFQWGTLSCLVLLMVVLYMMEVKKKSISRVLSRVSQFNAAISSNGFTEGAELERWQHKLAGLVPWWNLARLVFYWIDIILDIASLVTVWGNWPGYVLLALFLLHYIVSSVMLAWRLSQLGYLPRRVMHLGMLVLLPLMPFLDTVMFLSLAFRTGAMNHIGPQPQNPASFKHWEQSLRLHLLALDWTGLYHMRDVLEVMLEAMPTAVLQSLVFVLGNDPSTGWFIRPALYFISNATSSGQILLLVLRVLLLAIELDVLPWKAWWVLASYKGGHYKLDETTLNSFCRDVEGLNVVPGFGLVRHVDAYKLIQPVIAGGSMKPRSLLDLL